MNQLARAVVMTLAAVACHSRTHADASDASEATSNHASAPTPDVLRMPEDTTLNCLHYEPASVRLRGVLRLDVEFGPPNYGETPTKDRKVHVPILLLSRPINVCARPGDEPDADSFRNVAKIQLIFPLGYSYDTLVNHSIVVSGKLGEGISGHHYTNVIMAVDSARVHRREQ